MMFKKLIRSEFIVAMCLLCVIGTGASAQDSLSLESFLERVVSAHPSLRSVLLENDIAVADIDQARGAFDLLFKGKFEMKNSEGKEKLNTIDAGLDLPLATMFGPRLQSTIRRGDGPTVNPETNTDGALELGLGMSVPLWQGFGTDSRRTNLMKSKMRPALATLSYEQERNNLLRQSAQRYWDWVEATQVLNIMDDLVRIAESRSQLIARRAQVGEVAAIDTIEALQELERRRGERFRSERQSEQASIAAQALLWSGVDPSLAMRQRPQSLPAQTPFIAPPIATLRAESFKRRAEARRLEVQEQLFSLDRNLADELQRPLIEAQGMYLNRSLTSNAANSYKIGLNVSHPLFMRTATAQEEIAALNVQRTSYQRIIVERQINADIDDALSAVTKAEQRIQVAEREVQFSKIVLQAEVEKYTRGESSLLFTNIRERAVAEARIRLTNARSDFYRAIASYKWATASW